MAAPIPSFFKIRCWLVIIAFVLFFMFLGAVKRGFAATCQDIQDQCASLVGSEWTLHYGYESDEDAVSACRSDHSTSGYGWDCTLYTTSCLSFRSAMWMGTDGKGDRYILCTSADCAEECSSASQECGCDDNYAIDTATCEWQCTNCPEERARAAQQCGSVGYSIDNETCEWNCKSDSDGDGNPDDKDPCPSNPDPDCDANGNGVPDEQELLPYDTSWLPYGVDPSPFAERWTAFVDYLKDTSFFSIPSQVFGGFDSGSGDSSLPVEGGETFGGSHAVEFSTWIPGLAALRGVLYACFCIIAVRIVTLKH